MAKINVNRLKQQAPDSQQPMASGMYSNYSKDISPITNMTDKGSNYQDVKVKKEQGKFYKLRQLIYGPNVIPDLDFILRSNLSQSQLRKIERQENYYRRIQSTINWGISRNDGDRRLRYMEYDRMEWMTPEVGRALDVLAADASLQNPDGDVVTIETDNAQLEEELRFLFNEVLDINGMAFQYIRDTLKYGDSYYMIHIDAKKGIKKLVPLPVEHVDREVGFDEHNPFAYRYRVASMGGDPLEPYEIAHFRLKTSMDFDEYGKSALENGRRIWRQLITLEDSMIIYRLVRAPQRRIFYFDIGNIRSDQIEAAVNKFANSFKKDRIYDQDGIVDYRLSLQSLEEDFVVPKRGNQDGNKIDTLESQEWAAIDDVNYIHQKFITSLGVPNSYLGYEEALNSKSTLGSEDVRYSQYVQRIQRSFIQTLEQLMLTHLYIRGYRTADITDVKISLTNPSHINELQELEIFQARLSAERDAKDSKSFSTYWIKKNIWKLTDQEIEDEENQLIRDSIRNFVFAQGEAGVFLTVKDVLDYNSIEAQAAKQASQQGGGMGGEEMGGLGGGGGGMPPLGGEEMGGLGGIEEPPNPELTNLDNLEAPTELTSPDEIDQDIENNQ